MGHLIRLGLVKLIYDPVKIAGVTFADFRSGKDCDVLLVHEMLLPFPFFGKEILISEYDPPPSTKVVFVGHYHPGFPPVKKGDVTFYGIGSLYRLDRTDRHNVSVAILEQDFSVKFFELETPQDVFVEDLPVKFEVEELPELSDLGLDLRSLILEVAKKRQYSSEAVRNLFELLEAQQ